ncbi:hypothetical protein Tco_1393915 [Tanacetum coccineum]
MFKRRLIAADQASVFMAITSVHISSGLVLHQMTSDHNRSELGIHDHSNEPSCSKLVPKVVPLAVVWLGINPMIFQPEPEDLPKDNPKLEIAVLRIKKKCMDKGSKERSPPHNLRQKPGQYICCQNHKLIADIENDIMDPVMQCTTLPSHSGFSQQKLVSFVTEIHTLSIDISLRDTRLRELMSSSGAPSTPSYSAGHSTPPSYSSGPSTPTNYSLRSSRNGECSNCKHLRGKISVLKATMEMHMHPEQHTVNSAALFHEVLNEMKKLDLE